MIVTAYAVSAKKHPVCMQCTAQIVRAVQKSPLWMWYNKLDTELRANLHHAHKKVLPVVIMEPLRGCKLVNNLPRQAKEIFAAHPAGYTPAQWALPYGKTSRVPATASAAASASSTAPKASPSGRN